MIVFDVEADNLLDDATKIHCLSYTSDGENYKTLFNYDEMRELVLSQRGLIGHNIYTLRCTTSGKDTGY